MSMSIQKFIFSLVATLFSILYILFFYYHFAQQEKTAEAILRAINSQMLETSYHLSKEIKSINDVASLRAMLDRIASNGDFIDSIFIHDEDEILISTDPFRRKTISTNLIFSSGLSAYDKLEQIEAIEEDVRFYEGKKATVLKLTFVLDKDEISLYFSERKSKFLLYFGLAPIFIFIFLWFLLRGFIAKPLERLRQFAYYQSEIPKAFKLRELETIRYSMVQTFQRLENEKKELYDMARTDMLSGLANRNALEEYAHRLIANSSRERKEFAFLFVDLDNFKDINDSLGHNVGDELLKKISSMISEALRSNDFVARVGGDEFVVIVEKYHSIMELTAIVERIQNYLEQTWIIQTHPISVGSSIGIAFYPKDGRDLISLMKNSDIAMYEAKNRGRGRYHFFTEELNKRVQDSISLDKNMRKALENDEYQLHYQPKIDIKSGTIVGAEALIRWVSPTQGSIAPDVFISLAEENGFINELGWWVLQDAIRQHTLWKNKGIDISISINVSAKQLLGDNFIDQFKKLLDDNEVDPGKIDIEITEYLFLQHSEENSKILHELHDYGVKISLDDFGTGYSSLSYLKRFPIDNLKIDKAFIDDYDSKRGSIFVDTIVKMGQTLNMKVIAEGVEHKEQVEYLSKIGCDQYQGYYFSRALNADDFETLFLEQSH
ncbi:EAL domain-containing protein [Sulfurimonas crateris]|uniref:EAL domain-containing protein n=2 Tax=Sulfurimonas crateris TaxID=2574727 RepID=A0A4V5TLR1_9BACT|nr:EAL domain-containing protein [Sulfurimonas crateris]